MEPLYEEDNVEALMGLNESLESRDAPEVPTASDSAGGLSQGGNRKRKTTSQVWSHFELLLLAEDGKKKMQVCELCCHLHVRQFVWYW